MPDSIHDQIENDRKTALPEATLIKTFRKYARGRQKVTLNNYQRQILRGVLGNMFCDNICKKILGELRNRLKLARFEVIGEESETAPVLNYLKDVWTKNKLSSFSNSVHWAMMRDGNTAVGIKWLNDKVRVQLTRERWWNGKYGIFMAYNDDDEVIYAVRDWKEGSDLLRTIWFPDKIERFVQANNSNGWRARKLPEDNDVWPISWTTSNGEPLGVPFVHFSNLQVPNDGAGDDGTDEPNSHYGFSELDGGMIGLQDEINDVHRDITSASRYAGFPMLKLLGITRDPEKSDLSYSPEPGAAIIDNNEKAIVDFVQPGSVEQLEKSLLIKLKAVSRNSGIPEHFITGNWPSGEAVMRIERPMEDKVETIGSSVAPAWSSVAHKSVVMSNTFGGTNFNEESLISALFESAFKRDPLTLAMVAEKIAPYVSRAEILRMLGKSPSEIQKILTEMAGEIAQGITPPNIPGQRGPTPENPRTEPPTPPNPEK